MATLEDILRGQRRPFVGARFAADDPGADDPYFAEAMALEKAPPPQTLADVVRSRAPAPRGRVRQQAMPDPRALIARKRAEQASIPAGVSEKLVGGWGTPGRNSVPYSWLSPEARASVAGGRSGIGWDLSQLTPGEFRHLMSMVPGAQDKLIDFVQQGRIEPQVLQRLINPEPARGKAKAGVPTMTAKRSRR